MGSYTAERNVSPRSEGAPGAGGRVAARLTAERRRRVRVRRAKVRLWCAPLLCAGLAVLLLGVAAEWRWPTLGAIAVVYGAAAALLGGTLYVLLRRPSVARIARDIDTFLRARMRSDESWSSDQVATAMGLLDQDTATGHLSADLADAHLARTAEALNHIDLSPLAAVRFHRARTLALVATAAVLAATLIARAEYLVEAWEALTHPLQYAARVAEKNAVAGALFTGDWRFSYTYPAYMGLPEKSTKGRDAGGSIIGWPGTEVTLHATTLTPLTDAELVITRDDGPDGGAATRLPATVAEQSRGGGHARVRGQMTLVAPGEFRLEGHTSDGALLREPIAHRIVLKEDTPPEIRLTEPTEDLILKEDGSVTIAWEARDDFGVGAVSLQLRRRGLEESLPIERFLPAEREASGTWEFSLTQLPLPPAEPGEKITCYLAVEDTDTVNGPKIGVSDSFTIEVYSELAVHRRLMERVRNFMEASITALADGLERPGDLTNPQVTAYEEDTTRDLHTLAEEAVDIDEALDDDTLAPPPLATAMAGMARRLPTLAEHRRSLMERGAVTNLARLRWPAERTEHEHNVLVLDRLLREEQVADAVSTAEELLADRAAVMDLLEKVKAGEASMEELRAAVRELLAKYQKLRDAMMQATPDGLPAEFVNADALQHLPVNQLDAMLDSLMQAAESGALGSLEDMLASMEAELAQVAAGVREAAGEFDNAMANQAMAELEDMGQSIAALEREQRRIMNETEQLNNAALKEMLEGQKADLDKMVRDTLRKLDKLDAARARGEDIARQTPDIATPHHTPVQLYPEVARELAGMERSAEYARDRLEHIDIATVMRQMRDIGMRSTMAQDRTRAVRKMAPDASDLMRDQLAGFDGEMQTVKRLADEIYKDLSELGRRNEKRGQAGADADKSEELAGEQAEARDAAGKLGEQANNASPGSPLGRGEIRSALRNAERDMGLAHRQLGQNLPGGALPSQQNALHELGKARRDIEAAKKSLQQQGMLGLGMRMGPGGRGMKPGGQHPGNMPARGPGGGDGGFDTDDWKIPDQDAYKVPEEFREEILKAMKDKSPREYKELNDDYYKELIQ